MRDYTFRGVSTDGEEVFGNLQITEKTTLGGFFKRQEKDYRIQLEGLEDEVSVSSESVGQFVTLDAEGNQLYEYDLVKVKRRGEGEGELVCIAILIYSSHQFQYILVNVASGESISLFQAMNSLSVYKIGNAFIDSCCADLDNQFSDDIATKILTNQY